MLRFSTLRLYSCVVDRPYTLDVHLQTRTHSVVHLQLHALGTIP